MVAGRRRATREEREEQVLLTVKRIWDLPLSSARDLSGYGDFTTQHVHALLQDAARLGLVGCIRAGATFNIQRRYYQHQRGIDRVQERFGLPLTWQVTEAALHEHVRRLRLYEPVNRLMPILFRSGAVRTPTVLAVEPGDDPREIVLDQSTVLDAFTWFRDIQETHLHAIARYRTPGGELTWIPVITSGLHHGAMPRPADLTGLYAALDTLPDFQYSLTPASPIGALFVVLDRLAGLDVRLSFPSHLPMAIVDAQGHVIEQMDPVAPAGRVLEPGAYPGPVGDPEEVETWFHDEQTLTALQGVPNRKIFEWIHSFPGSAKRSLASGIGHPPSKVTEVLASFVDADLVAELGERPYLELKGRRAAAQRDRQHPNAVHNRFGVYTDPDSSYRKDQREHDHGVARLAAIFRKAGIHAYAGWRLEIIYDDGRQIKPDLWVLIPVGGGWAMWHAVEYERSARAESQIPRKLRPYRGAAREKGDSWPMLMVCGQGKRGKKGRAADLAVARSYMEQGDDLQMLVMPTHEAFGGRLVAPGAHWLWKHRHVPITHLVSTTDRYNPALLERIDTPSCWPDTSSASRRPGSGPGGKAASIHDIPQQVNRGS